MAPFLDWRSRGGSHPTHNHPGCSLGSRRPLLGKEGNAPTIPIHSHLYDRAQYGRLRDSPHKLPNCVRSLTHSTKSQDSPIITLMRILVVEDERRVVNLICRALRENEYGVEVEDCGVRAVGVGSW